MIIQSKISDSDLLKIALQVKVDFLKSLNSIKTTVFLCGGDINQKNNLRSLVAQGLSDWLGKNTYDLIYPEDIFDQLLYSSKAKDLLSMENLLADSVDVIIIIPESPGSFAELGAFANNSTLRNKLICLIDPKYKKHKSFINQGPVKLIRKTNKEGVLYIGKENLERNFNKLKSSIRKIKSSNSKVKDRIGLLQLDHFLLPLIYLCEPIHKLSLVPLIEKINEDRTDSFQATTIALSILMQNKLVEYTINGYKLTSLGSENFINLQKSRHRAKSQEETIALDKMRLEILNLQYRGKKLKV